MSGADGGAIVNTLLIDHFQSMARDHFIILRLEKKHGQDMIMKINKQLIELIKEDGYSTITEAIGEDRN